MGKDNPATTPVSTNQTLVDYVVASPKSKDGINMNVRINRVIENTSGSMIPVDYLGVIYIRKGVVVAFDEGDSSDPPTPNIAGVEVDPPADLVTVEVTHSVALS